MTELTRLQPSRLWTYFAQICQIPHPSKHEHELREWIIQVAESKQCRIQQDQKGNLLIRKPATPGHESSQTIALQAHMDMVTQATQSTQHDFFKDPIQPYIDGQWVKARGTTLGADNGIGLASCLAILTDPSLTHGPLEILLTVDEEAGMGGAFGLQANWLTAKYLINTDAERDSEIFIGCAGGLEARIEIPVVMQPTAANNQLYKIEVQGLKGGHSGLDIHKNRGNAIKILARLLFRIKQSVSYQLTNISGGNLRNAIPREASAEFLVPISNHLNLMKAFEQEISHLKKEHQISEPKLNIIISSQPVKHSATAFSEQLTNQIINYLTLIPNGCQRMSPLMPDIVETSTNLGVLKLEQNHLILVNFIRSLTDEGRLDVRSEFDALAETFNFNTIFSGDYSGWEPDNTSNITQIAQKQYQKLFGHKPKLEVIHAGLECGLFKKFYPELDMVSIGPTIENAHSPDEQVSIPSVQRYWQLLTNILSDMTQR